MAHNKVFGICESKCMVEVPTLTEFDSLSICNFITFVVKDNTSLTEWANNANNSDGKLYKHVLVLDGDYTASVTINLKTTGTLTITGSCKGNLTNTTINGNGSGLARIDGVNAYKFDYCKNLSHCKALYNNRTDSGFYNCTYLSKCEGAFKKCNYLTECISTFFMYDIVNDGSLNIYSDDGFGGSVLTQYVTTSFLECKNLTYCKVEIPNGYTHPSNANNKTFIVGFAVCNYVQECNVNQGSMYSGFNKCFGIRYCYSFMSSYSEFYDCYQSLTKDNSYKADNTLNGGFNKKG